MSLLHSMFLCNILQFDQYLVRDLHSVFTVDSLSSSHPLYVPVKHPDQINEIFDKISYLKVSPPNYSYTCE